MNRHAVLFLKRSLKRILFEVGYEIHRIHPPGSLGQDPYRQHRVHPPGSLGQDPFRDMRSLTVASESPVVFDVGANTGQSVERFRKHFASPEIHAFEPNPATFEELVKSVHGIPGLHLNKTALGARIETRTFIENINPDMSSFLEPGIDCWGEVLDRKKLGVTTIDSYCASRGVSKIDILKSDTQGFDLEVLNGAVETLRSRGVHMVYLEIIFSDMYLGLPGFDETFRLLLKNDFRLVSFYEMNYQNERASWTDALFINPEYKC